LSQTREAVVRIEKILPRARFDVVAVETPGDRDRVTDLRDSPPDFFTRDLDAAVRSGAVDGAIHSAKDLPDPVSPDLDWFWLPWAEDARDAIVLPAGRTMAGLPAAPVVGISSERRAAYGRERFPGAVLRPIRGNIEERLAQLDAGDFDLTILAAAGLLRLGLAARIAEWIPLESLPPPEGQGHLALTFRQDDRRVRALRNLFVHAVTFAGAGAGSAEACTVAGVEALRRCDVCLFDSLMDPALLSEAPETALRVDVGKRCGAPTLDQDRITTLLLRYARQGRRVVRLKGGDPGIFGRLAEETEALDARGLPYRVIPGISSLQAATTATGLLLTRRGVSRGFCAMTPRAEGGAMAPVDRGARGNLPVVFFMATAVAARTAADLIADGMAPETPAAWVFDAGGEGQTVVRTTLAELAGSAVQAAPQGRPGLLIVGEAARHGFRQDSGALAGRRILLTCSESLLDKAAARVRDFGGVPVRRPLIRLVPVRQAAELVARMDRHDWVALTSPSAVRCLAKLLRTAKVDSRSIPRVMVCGGGTASELESALGLRADLQPDSGFGAEGLARAAKAAVKPGERILRLRSDRAGAALSESLSAAGARVTDCVLYENKAVPYDAPPSFDAVFFASSSAVEAYVGLWAAESLAGKIAIALGTPTARALASHRIPVNVLSPESTAEGAIEALAAYFVNASLA